MKSRGYSHDPQWDCPNYRGKVCDSMEAPLPYFREALSRLPRHAMVYPEHDANYLKECLDNLRNRGIEITL